MPGLTEALHLTATTSSLLEATPRAANFFDAHGTHITKDRFYPPHRARPTRSAFLNEHSKSPPTSP
jgi:hypothetical protein